MEAVIRVTLTIDTPNGAWAVYRATVGADGVRGSVLSGGGADDGAAVLLGLVLDGAREGFEAAAVQMRLAGA